MWGSRAAGSAMLESDELLLLRAGVARLNDGLIILDAAADGTAPRISFVNEACERLTGWTRGELVGQPLMTLEGGGASDEAKRRLAHAWRTREPLRIELLLSSRSDREFWADLDLMPIPDADGRDAHWIAILRDISDRRQLEEQLFHAQKMDAVGRLAGGVAHDFNNLLTAIGGFSELLLEDLPRGSGPHAEVAQIKAAADRATALTRQLLAFSRKQILRPRHVDVNGLVLDLERLMRRVISARVIIRTAFEEPLPSVYADPVQLEQVLINLVVNASDAMPEGGLLTVETGCVTLGDSYISRHHGVEPGRYVCLIVSDTGHGMDRTTRERMFEPFFTTKPSGTGLGLSTVYGIVRQSGGHVWVYSEVGVGTTFKVYLPVSGAPADDPVTDTPVAVVDGHETVLVVEDESAVREVARAMLQRRGYTVLVAADGDQAQRVADRHVGPIDLLLTDVVLPRANGKRVAEQLTARRPDLKVLYMSGYTEDTVVFQGVLGEGIRLLEKPFSESALATRVREALDAAPTATVVDDTTNPR